jgi:hypothetical protein
MLHWHETPCLRVPAGTRTPVDETAVTLAWSTSSGEGSVVTFTGLHIVLTSLLCGVLVFGAGLWRLRGQWRQALLIGGLAALAVWAWRTSANMPQLNDDGLQGFSANDWAAPILAYLVLIGYADLRPPADTVRYNQVRALAGLICLVVNVVTI